MALPDGIYDRLVDARLLEELKELIESEQVTLEQILAGERPSRLAGVIARLIEEALDEIKIDDEVDTRERAQLAVISALLGTLRRESGAGAEVAGWPRTHDCARSWEMSLGSCRYALNWARSLCLAHRILGR